MKLFIFPITAARNNWPLSIGQIIRGETPEDDRRTRLKQPLIDLYLHGFLTDEQLTESLAEHGLKHA